MAIKIKQLKIAGLRGIKECLTLNLGGKSALLYGDNGTGKSSISDSLEWFYLDSVSHLTREDINLKEALRNSYVTESTESSVSLFYTNPILNSDRKLFYNKGKLVTEFDNHTQEFYGYIQGTRKENLLLRHQFLRSFIDGTKSDKLRSLSDIIGFSEVTQVKAVLMKSYNSTKAEIKKQNFENQISLQKQLILEKIGAAISQEIHLFEKVNEIILPLNLGITVVSMNDIDSLLLKLRNPNRTQGSNDLMFLEKCHRTLALLKNEIELLDTEYTNFYVEFEKIAKDVQSIMQTLLADMLKAGNDVIIKKYHKEDSCPLCLQPKKLTDLQAEILARLQEIEDSSKKKLVFDLAKTTLFQIAEERIKRINDCLREPLLNDPSNETLKRAFNALKEKIQRYKDASEVKVTSGNSIDSAANLKLDSSDFGELKNVSERIGIINSLLAKDNTTVIYSNISAAKDAFVQILKFENDKQVIEAQKNTLEIIYNEFVKIQREALQNFIDKFSGTIDEYYQFMNPNELFQEIRIATIGNDDELNGITVEYRYNGEWVSPPQKYFSESHLNCLGISFFLASVVAYNKENRFIVLDDVISSFDTTHRKKFADLLIEVFAEYQIILLTHEEQWFQYLSPIAKKKGWQIHEIKWNEENGTHLDEQPSELKESIEKSIASGDIKNVGNPIRRYLEGVLKKICIDFEIKMKFRLNDNNEKRMPDEMISELRSSITKKSSDLKEKMPVIDRLSNSNVLANLLSHDNPFDPKLGDIKSLWDDILVFEKIFNCQEANCKKKNVTIKNYDSVARKIRCGCDATKYDWK